MFEKLELKNDNGVLRTVCRPKTEKVAKGCRNYEELRKSQFHPTMLRWMGHAARTGI